MIADKQIKKNKRKSFLIIAITFLIMSLLVWAISFYFFGGFTVISLIMGIGVIAMTFVSYYKSDVIALRSARAIKADPVIYKRLYNLVEGLTIASGLPMPSIYIVNDPSPNAFATGRDPKHASIAVTMGLLEQMNRVELEGVLAHELSHVKNYDILLQTICVATVGAIALISDVAMRGLFFSRGRDSNEAGGSLGALLAIPAIVLIIFSPILARLMQFSLSREREFLADASAVTMTRYPPGLISALNKLRDDKSVVTTAARSTSHLWIEEPLSGKLGGGKEKWLDKAFSTHPPLEQRIAVLEQL